MLIDNEAISRFLISNKRSKSLSISSLSQVENSYRYIVIEKKNNNKQFFVNYWSQFVRSALAMVCIVPILKVTHDTHLMIGSQLNKSPTTLLNSKKNWYKLLEMLIDRRRELIDNLLMIWTLIDKEMMIKSLAILSITSGAPAGRGALLRNARMLRISGS